MDFRSSEPFSRAFLVGVESIFLEILKDLREQGVEVILFVEFFSAVNEKMYWFEGRKLA